MDTTNKSQEKPSNEFYQIFEEAKGVSLQYLYTLLRAEGWTSYKTDPLIEYFDYLDKTIPTLQEKSHDELLEVMEKIFDNYDVFKLIANIIKNAKGESYQMTPLPMESGPNGFSAVTPKDRKHILELIKIAGTFDNPFCKLLGVTISENILTGKDIPADSELKTVITKMSEFLLNFLKEYRHRLLRFKGAPDNIQKLPNQFMVAELLTDDQGLSGVKIHHETGSVSSFTRLSTGTQNFNYGFSREGEIELNMGLIDAAQTHWMFNGKPLYEKGLRGRYNEIGEWRPIIYPGLSSQISSLAHTMAKDDPDERLEGAIFYILATCYHTIEFIIKSNIDFTYDYLKSESNFGDIHYHKIDIDTKDSNFSSTLVVYDCTLELKSFTTESVKDALRLIDVFVQRLAFRMDSKAEWILKYKNKQRPSEITQVSEEDFGHLREYLMMKSDADDTVKIDTAIGWYMDGNHSANFFTKFLDYYIAFEGLATSLVEGKLGVSKQFGFNDGKSVEENKIECIKAKHAELYEKDPIDFIKKSYFECIQSLGKNTRIALEAVFGKEHKYIKYFYDENDGLSIYKLRHKLAHGEYSHIDQEHLEAVIKKLPYIRDISYDFIMRVSLGLKNTEDYPELGGHSISMIMADPRTTMVMNNFKMIENKDWKIRLQWLL
jgi:hypothetical protein